MISTLHYKLVTVSLLFKVCFKML